MSFENSLMYAGMLCWVTLGAYIALLSHKQRRLLERLKQLTTAEKDIS